MMIYPGTIIRIRQLGARLGALVRQDKHGVVRVYPGNGVRFSARTEDEGRDLINVLEMVIAGRSHMWRA